MVIACIRDACLVAISYVYYLYHDSSTTITWGLGIFAVLGAAIFQMSGNMISDYYDYTHGVDRRESFGSSRMIVEGVFTPKTILNYGLILLLIASIIGVYLWSKSSVYVLYIGIAGVIGTFFYYKLKYNALGDITIFIIYGELIALGTFAVLTQQLSGAMAFISAPLGFLIVNILHANNLRDIRDDRKAGIKTQAMLLGVKRSILQYKILGYLAYFFIIIAVAIKILPILSLMVVITLPLFFKNSKAIEKANIDTPEIIKDMDAASAQLVAAFSFVLILSNIFTVFL